MSHSFYVRMYKGTQYPPGAFNDAITMYISYTNANTAWVYLSV
jgi:hypothetical protein